jgi:alginate O-acetyltransferase complex protein AlgI
VAFNSIHFLLFFPVVFALYYVTPARWRWALLLVASLYFCGVGGPGYVLLLLATIGLTYFCGIRIQEADGRIAKKRYLLVGLFGLIGTLFVFKYFNFFNDNVRAVFAALGWHYPIRTLNLVLPLGISFYTFLEIAYLVDVYRGTVRAEKHVGLLALYVAFFPKLVAGPIERAKNLLPQLRAEHTFDYRQVVGGLQLIAWGAFQKVVVADRLAPFVQQVYGDPRAHDGVAMTLATWLFAFQVYCDFAGYTYIAIGAAQTMGYKLMDNFNRPYFAISIQDFWKRWHISLSSWLTDYVYTPLTRQKRVKVKLYYLMIGCLFITFVVSGLWHGAAWTFVFWGALHGLYLICSMLTRNWRARSIKLFRLDRVPRLHHALRIGFTFSLVCFAYIFFQSRTLSDAFYIVTHLPTGWGHAAVGVRALLAGHLAEFALGLYGIVVVIAVDVLQGYGNVREMIAARPAIVRWGLYYACAISIVLLGAFYDTNQQFIYFQF